MPLLKFSDVKIKPNYNHLEYLPYNTIGLGGKRFFKRTVIYQGELIDVIFAIDENGKVLDANDNSMALPCPRFCDDGPGLNIGAAGQIKQIGAFGIEFDTIPDAIPTGYDVSAAANLKKSGIGYNRFLELEIVDNQGVTKTALAGLDSNGRIMDDDVHDIIIK